MLVKIYRSWALDVQRNFHQVGKVGWSLNRSEVKRRTAVISKNVWKHAIVCQEKRSERNTNV